MQLEVRQDLWTKKKKSTGKKKGRLSRRSGEKKNQDEYAMLRKGTPIGWSVDKKYGLI